MRDVNDLNHEFLTEKTFRTKYHVAVGTTQYLGKLRVDEWLVRKVYTNSTTTELTITNATRTNNSYDNLDDAWTNKLTLTYE